MKCQNCGRNEATYYYKSSINGRVRETHLCADCARKLGYVQRMQPDSFFGDDFFSHPFRLFEPLLGLDSFDNEQINNAMKNLL